MKRKNSVARTLQKSKPNTHSYVDSKKTIKKSYNWKDKMYTSSNSKNTIVLTTGKNNLTSISRSFMIKPDREVFNYPMIPNVPLIDMECDNDCESEWPEIYESVNHLSMSLSLAIYDRMVERNGIY